MSKAARAIIIQNDQLLVMQRVKEGSSYYTLLGGQVDDHETIEQALVREVREETSLEVIDFKLVFVEPHPEPYNEQYIFLCTINSANAAAQLQSNSEEDLLNRRQTNIHTPVWVYASSFKNLPFRTPQLQAAIVQALKKGFPKTPQQL